MEALEVLDKKKYWEVWHKGLPNFIRNYYIRTKKTVNILEAGCGSNWHLDMKGIEYTITGVDISKEALEIRKYNQKNLDRIILGDLRTIEFNKAEYDVIYCPYVLEHINGAEKVLDKFFSWLTPNGLLLLLIPDRNTALGFLARIAPHWFHILYYKYVKKYFNAGKPGFAPFPTAYDKIISRLGINEYCIRNGYKIRAEYGSKYDPKMSFGVLTPLVNMFLKLIELTSFRRLSSKHIDLIFVINNSL